MLVTVAGCHRAGEAHGGRHRGAYPTYPYPYHRDLASYIIRIGYIHMQMQISIPRPWPGDSHGCGVYDVFLFHVSSFLENACM